MLPIVAIVGRPNVGKSTLFNRLTRTRDALVADTPGLTRDRQVGVAARDDRPFLVVDTGGLGADAPARGSLEASVEAQALRAVREADVLVLVVDAREGLTAADELVASRLRSAGKPVLLAVNKSEGLEPSLAGAEFHALGVGEPQPVSARRGSGVSRLVQAIHALHPRPAEPAAPEAGVRVALAGRPNVGKSTLINRLLGEERVLTHEAPGTTRDSIPIPFERDGQRYTLVDTAGLRRRARVSETVEKFSAIRSFQSVHQADVVVFLLDAREGVTDQDASIVGLALDAGRPFVIAVNKWDGLDPDERRRVRAGLERKLAFAHFAPVRFISALHGSGLGELWTALDRVWTAASRDLPTPELTRILREAVAQHPPPTAHGRAVKLRYAHQGGRNPPLIVVHGNRVEAVPAAYRRYLAGRFRDALGLEGTPLRIELRRGRNPYASEWQDAPPGRSARPRRPVR